MVRSLKDGRVVYGARCSWWETIDKAATRHSGLPACPHCLGPLFEVENLREWWDGAARYEDDGHPGYVDFLRWDRGKCYPTLEAALLAHAAEIGSETGS